MSKTVNQMTPDDAITGTEEIYVNDNGVDKKVNTEQIKDYVLENIPEPEQPNGAKLSSTTW